MQDLPSTNTSALGGGSEMSELAKGLLRIVVQPIFENMSGDPTISFRKMTRCLGAAGGGHRRSGPGACVW